MSGVKKYRQYLKMVYPVLPPTSNKIYYRGTILTGVSREYAESFAAWAAKNHLHEINELNPDGLFALHLRFFFNTLVNETYQNENFLRQRERRRGIRG